SAVNIGSKDLDITLLPVRNGSHERHGNRVRLFPCRAACGQYSDAPVTVCLYQRRKNYPCKSLEMGIVTEKECLPDRKELQELLKLLTAFPVFIQIFEIVAERIDPECRHPAIKPTLKHLVITALEVKSGVQNQIIMKFLMLLRCQLRPCESSTLLFTPGKDREVFA